MNKYGPIALFAVICFSSSCFHTQNKSDVNRHLEAQIQMTDTLYGHPLKGRSENFDFLEIEEIEFRENGLESIKLEKIANVDVPGDYHKISFKFADNTVDSFFNKYGWVKTDTSSLLKNNSILNENNLLQEYILVLYSKDVFYFSLFGYTYANDPPLLTVFRLDKLPKINLVLNLERNLVQVKNIDSLNGLELVLTEYDAEVMQYIKKYRYEIYSLGDQLIYQDTLSSTYNIM